MPTPNNIPVIFSIELKALQFYAYHGLHPEEAKLGNTFEVDAVLYYESSETITSIEETINYVEVYAIIRKEMEAPKPLLETVVNKIGDGLHKTFPKIKKLTITLKKLTPPITNFRGTVGVSYTKQYS